MSNIEEMRAELMSCVEAIRNSAQKIGPEVNEVIEQSQRIARLFEGSSRTELLDLTGIVFAASQKIDEALMATLMAGDQCEQAAGML